MSWPSLYSFNLPVLTLLGLGYTLGGLAGDAYLPLPFQITLGLLVVSTIFTSTCLPYIPPAASIPPPFTSSDDKKKESAFSFLDCMKVFLPVRLDESRNKGAFWGLTLLGTGAFIGVLATSYVPLMLQLVRCLVFYVVVPLPNC